MREWPCLAVFPICLAVLPSLSAQEAGPAQSPASSPERRPFAWLAEDRERPERDEIETDRDSFTPATSTVGRGRLIFESAYSFLDNRRVKETHSLPEALFRYGLTERLELRLGANYEVGGAGNDVSGSGASGGESEFTSGGRLERASTVSYGLKFRVTDQREWLPASSVLITGGTPTSGPENHTALTAAYVFGWELPGRWKLDAAMRARTDQEREDHFTTWAPSVVLKVPVGERFNVHAEYFGLFSQGKEVDFVRHYVSPGAHYLITEDVEIGVRVGWGLNDQSAQFFANVGLGLRF